MEYYRTLKVFVDWSGNDNYIDETVNVSSLSLPLFSVDFFSDLIPKSRPRNGTIVFENVRNRYSIIPMQGKDGTLDQYLTATGFDRKKIVVYLCEEKPCNTNMSPVFFGTIKNPTYTDNNTKVSFTVDDALSEYIQRKISIDVKTNTPIEDIIEEISNDYGPIKLFGHPNVNIPFSYVDDKSPVKALMSYMESILGVVVPSNSRTIDVFTWDYFYIYPLEPNPIALSIDDIATNFTSFSSKNHVATSVKTKATILNYGLKKDVISKNEPIKFDKLAETTKHIKSSSKFIPSTANVIIRTIPFNFPKDYISYTINGSGIDITINNYMEKPVYITQLIVTATPVESEDGQEHIYDITDKPEEFVRTAKINEYVQFDIHADWIAAMIHDRIRRHYIYRPSFFKISGMMPIRDMDYGRHYLIKFGDVDELLQATACTLNYSEDSGIWYDAEFVREPYLHEKLDYFVLGYHQLDNTRVCHV